MANHSLYWLVGFLRLPHDHGVVVGAGDQALSLGVLRFLVPFRGVLPQLFGIASELVVLSGVIVWASLEHVVSAERESVDPVSMTFEIVEKYALLCVPAFDRPVLTCRIDDGLAAPENFRG